MDDRQQLPCKQAREANPPNPAAVRACIRTGFPTDMHGTADAVLQTVAQVVIERATLAAWEVLSAHLKDWLQCTKIAEGGASFARTCKLIGTVRLQELVAAPDNLLSAVAADLLRTIEAQVRLAAVTAAGAAGAGAAEKELAEILAVLRTLLEGTQSQTPSLHGDLLHLITQEYVKGWKVVGMKDPLAGVREQVLQRLLEEMTQAALSKDCPAPTGDGLGATLRAAEWVIGRCLVKADEGNTASRLAACKLPSLIASCADDSSLKVRERIGDYVALLSRTIKSGEAKVALRLPFMVARDSVKECREESAKTDKCEAIDAMESVILGIEARDWIKVTSGAVELASLLNLKIGKSPDALRRLLSVVAAVSQMAYHPDNDKEASKTRRDVLEGLIKSMVSRSNRVGWVVSLGGSFGLAAAYRTTLDAPRLPGLQAPFALPLGFGLQSYSDGRDFGFHLQVSVLDLGQYVAWEGEDFTVQAPNIQDAVSLGINFGGWFGSRHIPIFLGPHLGIAPFARNHAPSFFIGGLLGAYVPFIDLN